MNLTEKAAFLKGLAEGSELNLGSKEKKIFDALLELVSDLAEAVSEVDEDLTTLYDDVDELYDEVENLSDDVCELFDEDGCCECDDDRDDVMYEIECDKCGEKICVDEETLLSGDVECPNCGAALDPEFGCDCDCDDCRDKEKE